MASWRFALPDLITPGIATISLIYAPACVSFSPACSSCKRLAMRRGPARRCCAPRSSSISSLTVLSLLPAATRSTLLGPIWRAGSWAPLPASVLEVLRPTQRHSLQMWTRWHGNCSNWCVNALHRKRYGAARCSTAKLFMDYCKELVEFRIDPCGKSNEILGDCAARTSEPETNNHFRPAESIADISEASFGTAWHLLGPFHRLCGAMQCAQSTS